MEPSSLDPGLGALLAILLILANGFFVGGELAIVRSRHSRLEELAEGGDRLAGGALRVVRQIDTYLAVSQLGITITSLALGALGEPSVAALLASPLNALGLPAAWLHPLAYSIAFAAIAFAQIVIGELVPKSLAIIAPERAARLVAPPFRLFALLARPVIWLLTATSRLVLALFGQRLDTRSERAHSEVELQLLLTSAEEHGHLDAVEQDLASRSLELGDIPISEIMIPRVAIAALADDADLAQARQFVMDSGHDWLPVYHGSRDEIIGLIEWRELFAHDEPAWQARIHAPLFLPESLSVSTALAKMMEAGPEMAVALDEYGGTAGIVTVRTLFEVLTRRDQSWSPADEIPGRTSLRVIEDLVGAELGDESQVDTIGGLVTALLGHFPAAGEEVRTGGWTITVTRGSPHRVEAVRLTPPASDAG